MPSDSNGGAIITRVNALVSSSEPFGSQGELIVYQSSRRLSVVHHFQISSSLKPFGQSEPNFMWSILGKGGPKFI